jgi:hypothetical protein
MRLRGESGLNGGKNGVGLSLLLTQASDGSFRGEHLLLGTLGARC